MEIRFQGNGPAQWKADMLITFVHKGEHPAKQCAQVDAAAPWLAISPSLQDFHGKKNESVLCYGHPDLPIPRVLVIGLGEKSEVTLKDIRVAMASALQRAKSLSCTSVLLPAPVLDAIAAGSASRLTEEAIYGALMGLYAYRALRSPKSDEPADPAWLALGCVEEFIPDEIHAAARRAERTANAMTIARDLANTPPNILYPETFAERALALSKKHLFSCTILDKEALEELGCNCLLAVGRGSVREPRMIVMEYCPQGKEQESPLILVGKGLTFDSGGICIKPAGNMHTMKSDMSGAAAVMGAMCAIADEEMPRRVIGILACAENMPDGAAMRPGDVVYSCAGKTVEILNTDAEGRLVLCDALAYAQKNWTPAAIVDIATLTGACAVALGVEVAGLFTDDAVLEERIRSIGTLVGEPCWPLPLWKNYKDLLKSEVADISHMGNRDGGAIQAALFLQEFIEKNIRWAHLDIAGTDWASSKSPLSPVGALGFGTRTLIELARSGV